MQRNRREKTQKVQFGTHFVSFAALFFHTADRVPVSCTSVFFMVSALSETVSVFSVFETPKMHFFADQNAFYHCFIDVRGDTGIVLRHTFRFHVISTRTPVTSVVGN